MPDSITGWPTANDLTAFLLSSTGLVSQVSPALTSGFAFDIEAGIDRFKRASGYYPFIGTQQVRTFSPPGSEISPAGPFFPVLYEGGSRILSFDGGLLSVNSVTTGTIGGGTARTLTLGTDYWLAPRNAPAMGQPYTGMEFRTAVYAMPSSITIDGVWGYQTKVSAMYAQAILADTAALVSPQVAISKTGLLVAFTDSDVREQYEVNPFSGFIPIWQAQMMRALATLRGQGRGMF